MKNVTTRHYFIFASNAMELREWMEAIVEGGATAAGPTFPMRVVGDSYRKPVASSAANGGASPSPQSYGGVDDTDPRNIPPFAFPVVLAKYGFLQKRGALNTSYKTRFCRIEPSPTKAPLLVYYANVETTPRNGEIPLTGVVIEDDKSNGDELSFKLTVAGKDARSYFLRAPSKAQKRKWMNLLKRVSEGETMATEDPRVAAAAAQAAAEQAAAASSHGRSAAMAAGGAAAAGGAGAGAAAGGAPAAPVQTRTDPTTGKVYKKRVVKRAAVNPDLGTSPPEGGAGAAYLLGGAAVGGAAVAASPSPGPVGSPANFSESPPPKSPTPNPHHAGANGHGEHHPHANGAASTVAASAASSEEHKHAGGPHDDEEEVVDDPVAAAVAHHARHNSESDSGGSAQWGRPYASGSVGEDGKPTASEIALAFERAGNGSDMFKIPTGSFASVEKKRFYLLDVATHARASKLLAESIAEMKKKDKTKVVYYESIKSGWLLHWESSKAFAYESFVWLDPKAPRTEWNLHFGQV